MPQPAIRVEGLGKKYQITHETRGSYKTLRESVMDLAATPARWMKGHRRSTQEDFWALKDVSFEVQRGEVVGIIGRNGAGKSTLLKILSRITKPTKGRVELNGRVGSLLEVGTGFHPELTGRENVYLNGSILGMTRREIDLQFDEIVAFAEVEKFLDTPVKRYSSGMYVRLAFAVAAHLEPEILIIDEVLAVGDAAFQKKCLSKLKQAAQNGNTVLLVSHQLNSLQSLCNQGLWLDSGRTYDTGSAARVLEHYLAQATSTGTPGQWIDLTNASRRGTSEVRFISARFGGNLTSDAPRSDGRMQLTMQLSCARHHRDAQLGALIYDRLGTCLVNLDTYGTPVEIAPGVAEATFVVESLHLLPGKYRVHLFAGCPEDYFDQISDAFELEVLPSESRLAHSSNQDAGTVTAYFAFSLLNDIVSACSDSFVLDENICHS